jgi:hypothetical protein
MVIYFIGMPYDWYLKAIKRDFGFLEQQQD